MFLESELCFDGGYFFAGAQGGGELKSPSTALYRLWTTVGMPIRNSQVAANFYPIPIPCLG
jgi:hypothetical protein